MSIYSNGDKTQPEGSVDPTLLHVFSESIMLIFSFSPDKYVASTSIVLEAFTVLVIIGLLITIVLLKEE